MCGEAGRSNAEVSRKCANKTVWLETAFVHPCGRNKVKFVPPSVSTACVPRSSFVDGAMTRFGIGGGSGSATSAVGVNHSKAAKNRSGERMV